MPATIDCVPCCSVPQSVAIPGIQGDPGNDGADGNPAYSSLTLPILAVPAVGATYLATVNITGWMVVGMTVIVGQGQTVLANPGPATFLITVVNSATTVTLQFLGYPGDVAPGATIDAQATITATNAVKMTRGTTTLVAGTKTVADANVTANSVILLMVTDWHAGGKGALAVTTITAATSFVIESSDGTEVSDITYLIIG